MDNQNSGTLYAPTGQDGQTAPGWDYNQQQATQYTEGIEASAVMSEQTAPIGSFSWTETEFIAHERGPMWMLAFVGSVLVLVVIAFIVSRDIFVTLTAIVVGVSAFILSLRKPKQQQYTVGPDGFQVADRVYKYSDFKSFSIVEDIGIDSIWLRPVKRFMPPVVMYFPRENEQTVAEIVAQFLPYEDRELDSIDNLSRRLRL